jgi:hypothetical protein
MEELLPVGMCLCASCSILVFELELIHAIVIYLGDNGLQWLPEDVHLQLQCHNHTLLLLQLCLLHKCAVSSTLYLAPLSIGDTCSRYDLCLNLQSKSSSHISEKISSFLSCCVLNINGFHW